MSEDKTRPDDLKLMTRSEVMEMLAPTENLTITELKPGDDIDVAFSGTKDNAVVNLNDRRLNVSPEALVDAGRCVGIGKKLTSKCPADRLYPILNYLYGEGASEPVRAIANEQELQTITKNNVKLRIINNEHLLRTAEGILGEDHIIGYHNVHAALDHSTIGIVTDRCFEPVEEDTLFGGINIYNSLTAREAIEVSPYIFRQWCSNGAITSHSLGRYTRKIQKKNDNLDDWFSEIISGVDHELEKEFERIRELTGLSVKGHLAETVESIGKDRRLPDKVIERVMERAISEKAETVYDVWNAFTWVASNDEEITSPIMIGRLMRTAGNITANPDICNTCHRVLN